MNFLIFSNMKLDFRDGNHFIFLVKRHVVASKSNLLLTSYFNLHENKSGLIRTVYRGWYSLRGMNPGEESRWSFVLYQAYNFSSIVSPDVQ